MTLSISSAQLSEMAARGQENNPIAVMSEYSFGDSVTSDSDVLSDGALINATDGGTYSFWRPDTAGQTSTTYKINFSVAKEINFLGIAAHNLAGSSVVVEVIRSGDVSWTDVNVDAMLSDNSNVGLCFTKQNVTDVRLTIGHISSASIYVGVVLVGLSVVFPTRIYQGYTPALQATSAQMVSNVTEGGNYVGTAVVRGGRSVAASLNYLDPSFVRGEKMQLFQSRFNRGLPMFWAWRPTKYGDLSYAWRMGAEINPQNSGPNDLMSFSMKMRAYDDIA